MSVTRHKFIIFAHAFFKIYIIICNSESCFAIETTNEPTESSIRFTNIGLYRVALYTRFILFYISLDRYVNVCFMLGRFPITLYNATDKTWEVLTSAETGRRHRHSRSATVEGTGSLRHFHDTILLLAAHRRHVAGGRRTGRGSSRRNRRDGYTGDAVYVRVPGGIPDGTAAVISTVIAVGRFTAHSVAIRDVDVARTAVVRRGAATHGGDTHHPLPRDILYRTSRSGANSRRLQDRILF